MKNLISNTATIAYRNLLKTLHNPDELLDVIVQPRPLYVDVWLSFRGCHCGKRA